ncbi:hypothetical protein N7536_008892 [Penicillium majusculum]|uniref:Uncharacterized protein n=1 Tax=Penicillium solitum TaxID=60172 RepID=A0A1V6QZU3_9EURO|nr:uncharacterized protein PENSOL_c024G07121 [Penicillium solitum]KAJ5686273.1 hypothetical protein N7536_008892 [Penicillium majusculum]OQD94723.1 hypothetical protein PENSOL_c024G07121 [Penicillium solitum]
MMSRSRFTGRFKPDKTDYGWYFAGEPMDKRHSRNGRIRLVRYGPEMDLCVHSRCPSPSPIPETAPCSCGNRCEVHPNGTRCQSPGNTDSSGYEAVTRYCPTCHGIRREPESPPQVEKPTCTCNHRCECPCHLHETRPITPNSSEYSSSESTTKRYGSRQSTRRERRSNDTRPTTPNSSDLSDYGPPRRRRTGQRTTKREPEHHMQVEICQCEAHAPPPGPPAMPGPRYNSARASFTTAPRPGPVVQLHYCRKAEYCESHPELCRASMPVPSPVPRLNPTPTRAPRSSEKTRRSPRVRPDQKCTCRGSASPRKQVPPPKPVSSSKSTSPRPDVPHCICLFMDGYYGDDSGYYTTYDDDTATETSTQAMPGDVDETRCVFHHRCRPRFERGLGWVCGRK